MSGTKVEIGDATLYHGDTRAVLPNIEAGSVQTCITSPPYFGLRDYGVDGQIGLEPTHGEFVAELVAVFRDVRRVLRDDGTLWLNLGDSYATAAGGVGDCPSGGKQGESWKMRGKMTPPNRLPLPGLKPKDLIGIPWRVAFALQADGWYLRSDIIWSKPNPMPESVTDRPTKSHEYLFLLAKSERYYFDQAAWLEPVSQATVERMAERNIENQAGSSRAHAGEKRNGPMRARVRKDQTAHVGNGIQSGFAAQANHHGHFATRNRRTVWTVATQPFSGAHFATFPPDLIRPCVMAGAPPGGVVLDPFSGAGTTGVVALEEGRAFIGIELNAAYLHEIAAPRIKTSGAQRRMFA